MEENLSSLTHSLPSTTDPSRIAFNRAASTYDSDFELLPGTRRLRSLLHAEMLRLFRSGESILELNCGTGTDALFLAGHGIHVHATDASPAMIDAVNQKKLHTQHESLVSTSVLSFENLDALGSKVFDGAVSNLGGINCCNDLQSLGDELGKRIREGGYLFVCVLSRYSPWELSSFLVRGKLKEARRRLTQNASNAIVHGVNVPVRYYSTVEIQNGFERYFDVVRTQGLNIITPPPASVAAHKRLRRVMPALEWIEDKISSLPPFNRTGDHVILVMQRRANS